MKKTHDDQYSEQETEHRRDAVIKRMLATPPKPQSEMKLGKPRAKKSASLPNKNATKGGMRT
jgi:hypothetical protein